MKSPAQGEAKVSVLVCPERLLQELGDWSDACRGFGVWEDRKVIVSSPQIIWFNPPPFFLQGVMLLFVHLPVQMGLVGGFSAAKPHLITSQPPLLSGALPSL